MPILKKNNKSCHIVLFNLRLFGVKGSKYIIGEVLIKAGGLNCCKAVYKAFSAVHKVEDILSSPALYTISPTVKEYNLLIVNSDLLISIPATWFQFTSKAKRKISRHRRI